MGWGPGTEKWAVIREGPSAKLKSRAGGWGVPWVGGARPWPSPQALPCRRAEEVPATSH